MKADETKLKHRDYAVMADFRYALRKFFKFSEDAAVQVGLTPQQYQALLAVRGYSCDTPMTVGDLAERMQLRAHSAVALVDRLAKKRLVVRRPAQQDKRQVFIHLTDEGVALLDQLAWVHREELRRMKAHIHTMADYLERV